MAPKVDKTMHVPLSMVHADFEWNCRSGDPALQGDSGGELDTNEFKSLVDSIRSRGQDEPVTVRAKGKGYQLVVGFRRYRAIQTIAEETKTQKTATILIKIRELNDVEARSLNIRENTARAQLAPPDLAFALVDLRSQYKAAGGSPTIEAMAQEVGVGRPYASKLFSIVDRVLPALLKKWRTSQVEIGVVKMAQIAGYDKDRQEEAFADLLPTAGRGAGGGRKGKGAWFEPAKKEAANIGTILGRLELAELISTEDLDFEDDIEKVLEYWGDDKGKATDAQRTELVAVISEAYEFARLDETEQAALLEKRKEEKKAAKAAEKAAEKEAAGKGKDGAKDKKADKKAATGAAAN